MRMSSRVGHHGGVRVLVVEDHQVLAAHIAEGLRDAGLAVDVAWDGEAALAKSEANPYDVVVLDRDLPKVHGDEVCAALVASSSPARIVMLTASGEIEDRVGGLDLGADDYLVKPFAFAELLARVRALARRSPSLPPVLERGDLIVDRARHLATRADRTLALNKKEFAILETLLRADGAVVSAEELLDAVWDEHADPLSNVVSVTIARLRRKLGEPPLITTVIGRGYRL